MQLTLDIEGLNLERLLRTAAGEGILLRDARRVGAKAMRVRAAVWQKKALLGLCERRGWAVREVKAGPIVRMARFFRRRAMLLPAAAMCAALVWLSSHTLLAIDIQGAAQNEAELRAILKEEGVAPGRWIPSISADELRMKLALGLPGLSFAGVRFAGSTMIVECQQAREGEHAHAEGSALDIVATQPGMITSIYASSGTPRVEAGQAVRKGQVLIAGYERTEKGGLVPVQAMGDVTARVWASGEARTALYASRTVETGRTRRRVTLKTPWSEKVICDAQPFELQDTQTERQFIVGLYAPLWREIETFAEIVLVKEARSQTDAAAMAQGAAEEMAKKQCPPGAEILDKWVEYADADEEYIEATVVLEYEDSIAGRTDGT